MTIRMKGKRSLILFLLLTLSVISMCACRQKGKQEQGDLYKIYYVNHEETAIFAGEYRTETTDTDALLEELITQLGTVPEKLEYKVPLSGSFHLLDYSITEDQLTLNFDEGYLTQSVTTEVLVRAAIVRTLTQIDGIRYVSFQVRTEPLKDASGSVIGVMNADMFIDNAGNEINTYEKAKLTLYLANETGDGLKKVTRTVVYSSNISVERLVVEQLIAGPEEGDQAYPTINPDTRIVSVNVKDGICYVNLDNSFLTQIYNVNSEVTIYSLTNSLAELSNVNKVQISINGDTNISYKENVNLSTVFERNLELVEQ